MEPADMSASKSPAWDSRRLVDVQCDAAPRLVGLSEIEQSIVEAVAYADVFDSAVTPDEIHRYLPRQRAELQDVVDCLEGDRLTRRLTRNGHYVCLKGREGLFEERRSREGFSRSLWNRAQRYAALIASAPYVRMVAVSGSLAVDSAAGEADIDFFVVTDPNHLWRARAWVKLIEVLDNRFGTGMLCANLFRTVRTLEFPTGDLYIAHELAQMVPLYDEGVYDEIRRRNSWALEMLPNAAGHPRPVNPCTPRLPWFKRLTEHLLGGRFGKWLEDWESTRKIERHRRRVADASEWEPSTRETTARRLFIGREILAQLNAGLSRLQRQTGTELPD
jgi:hypothetical protein